MNKYEVKHCTGFWLPTNDATIQVHKVDFLDVKIALGSWDEVEDAEDESIFYYMDDEPLEVGIIIGDGFVVTHIEEIE